jgi:2-dehydro-3-deoxyphosphogluconate aldolase / (4S)-4-hydroxy-2-oxoglutarate aldolase
MSSPKPLWPRDKAFEWFKFHKLVALIRTRNATQARGTIEALIKGGFKLIEVAMTVLDAKEVIRDFCGRTGVLVGAGSVMTERMAKDALAAGAQFLMTPHTDAAILKLAKRSHILCGAGALTPTEVVEAWTAGADVVRVYPVYVMGGPAYIHTLKEPFPDIPLVPSGGVTLENVREFFISGATAAVAAGGLMPESAVENGRWADLTAQAKKFQEVLQRL